MERLICQVPDNDDQTIMTITSEWLTDGTIEVMVLRESSVPLSGQTTVARQLQEYTRAGIADERALIDLRDELSGRVPEVKFTLQDGKLLWKKKAWKRGGIEVYPVDDVVALSDMSLRWLGELVNLRHGDAKKIEEDENMQNKYDRLIEELRCTEAMKKKIEDTLYSKFLCILNEKKNKIRLLEERLKNRVDRSAYDEETDEQSDDDRSTDSNDKLTVSHKKKCLSSHKNSELRRAISPESELEDEHPNDPGIL